MKISFAITVADESKEFKNLMDSLLEWKNEDDEIVILMDSTKSTPELCNLVCEYTSNGSRKDVFIHSDEFKGHFGDWKNKLNSFCKGNWIFQLDADEMPSQRLVEDLHKILENTDAECIAVPRTNVVDGITDEDIRVWGWRLTEKGINWPDYQWRLYMNVPEIEWVGKVHERPEGYTKYAIIPETQTIYRLDHFKNIEKQRKQNAYYSTL